MTLWIPNGHLLIIQFKNDYKRSGMRIRETEEYKRYGVILPEEGEGWRKLDMKQYQ